MSSPGPKAVDQAVYSHRDIGPDRDRRDWLLEIHQEHKSRVESVTNVAAGDWYTEWPDLSQTAEAPTIANQVEIAIQHWSAIGGAMLPSVKVPINKTADKRKEKPAARKRERRIRELWESSNASELCALWWGDYAGAGQAILGAWVNFEEKDPAKRHPYLIRFDPRHAYPLKDNNGNITELLIARKISKAELAAMYPDSASVFKRSDDEQVEEWFWYKPDRVMHQIVDVSAEGSKVNRNVTLVDKEWPLGFVPAWEVVLPTFDGKRRGIVDQSVHILRTMQRLMLMTILSTEENAFPAIASYDVVNPEDFGPGADIRYRSSEGRLDRLGPQSHFDVKDLVARLGEEAAKQSHLPQQLTGDPGASIVSARGIKASMGALDARLAVAHKQFEVGLGKVSGFLLAMDEVFCAGEKTIVGDQRDTSDAESYDPSTDVAGAWIVNCTYGLGAGSDPSNVEMRIAMNYGNGFFSADTARQQLSYLEDPDAEPIKIFREVMQQGLAQGIMAMAQNGDPTMAAKALRLLADSEAKDFDSVLEELVEAIMAPPETEGDPAADAALGAESLARGGIPGQAADAPDAAGLGLPPLGQLLGQDARMVS